MNVRNFLYLYLIHFLLFPLQSCTKIICTNVDTAHIAKDIVPITLFVATPSMMCVRVRVMELKTNPTIVTIKNIFPIGVTVSPYAA